jgi:putative FmdB family regulatory protein
MPTYQYKCPHCEHEFEEFQSITEEPISTCPQCGKQPRRIITGGAGFLLKGSGFYTTDYRSESYKAAAKKDKDAAVSSTAKTDTTKSKPDKSKSDKPKT